MKSVFEYISEWCGKDNVKKYLANIIIQRQEKNLDDIIGELFKISTEKVEIELCVPTVTANNNLKLCINSIKNPINIGALCAETEFQMGKKLNVFYGENGSGKSTYVKVFRKLSENYFTNSKNLSLKSNIYMPVQQTEQSVCVSYENGDRKVNDEKVNINVYHEELSKINVFDSDSLQPLLNKDLSFSVLPKGLDFFVKIKDLLESVKNELQSRIQSMENRKSEIFQDSKYKNLLSLIDDIEKKSKNTNEVIAYLDDLYISKDRLISDIENKKQDVAQMKAINQANLIQILNTQYKKLNEIIGVFQLSQKDFSEEKIITISNLQKQYSDLLEKEKNENEKLAVQVKNIVINSEWRDVFNSAQRYYNSQKQTQPVLGNRCILCGNEIGQEQEQFISMCFSHLKESANSKKRLVKENLNKQMPLERHLSWSESDKEIFDENKKVLVGKIESILNLIETNTIIFKSCVNENKILDVKYAIDFSSIITEIKNAMNEISKKLDMLSKSNGEILENIKKSEEKLIELNGALILYDAQIEFEQLFECKNSISSYNILKKKMNTTALTTKSQEAFKDIIGSSYLEIFNEYCISLGIKNVSVKLTSEKAKTKRSKYIVSESNAITDIMSEGEQKAIALAEFSSDLKIRENMCTVLFDDPVTSFDYKRAEKIAEIIYELSKERQVIVFTHNIMFYYKLYSLLEKDKDKENKLFKVDEYDRDNKGVISHTESGRLENLKDVHKRITNNAQEINSKKCIGDILERKLQVTYSDIRSWCELIFEEGFLRGAIRRYEPNIRFTMVPQINPEFTNELQKVYSLFEKACRYMTGHSQPIETLNTKPTREEFNEDFLYIKELYEKFH